MRPDQRLDTVISNVDGIISCFGFLGKSPNRVRRGLGGSN